MTQIPEDLDAATADLGLSDISHDHTPGIVDASYRPNIEAAVLNAVAARCWETSDEHGFHEDWQAAAWLEALADYMDKEERWRNDTSYFPYLIDNPGDEPPEGVERIATPDALRQVAVMLRNNIIGTKIALIHSELSEALESLRVVGVEGVLNGEGNVPEELADAKVRVDDLAGIIRAAIGDEQVKKMLVNDARPRKHGKKF